MDIILFQYELCLYFLETYIFFKIIPEFIYFCIQVTLGFLSKIVPVVVQPRS